ncbi:MAG: hypothetical protein EOP06_01230 [Proteobacteria bacterium]|nr:MAG: hypothetical protein EOP06_01230 [Pseudomonadota bacterium]
MEDKSFITPKEFSNKWGFTTREVMDAVASSGLGPMGPEGYDQTDLLEAMSVYNTDRAAFYSENVMKTLKQLLPTIVDEVKKDIRFEIAAVQETAKYILHTANHLEEVMKSITLSVDLVHRQLGLIEGVALRNTSRTLQSIPELKEVSQTLSDRSERALDRNQNVDLNEYREKTSAAGRNSSSMGSKKIKNSISLSEETSEDVSEVSSEFKSKDSKISKVEAKSKAKDAPNEKMVRPNIRSGLAATVNELDDNTQNLTQFFLHDSLKPGALNLTRDVHEFVNKVHPFVNDLCEGGVGLPISPELENLKELFYKAYPDLTSVPDISRFGVNRPVITEWMKGQLGSYGPGPFYLAICYMLHSKKQNKAFAYPTFIQIFDILDILYKRKADS